METALFGHDFSIQYVADNVARATPGLYTFTAAWSALEGSILLWALAALDLRRGHDVALPQPGRRPARRVGDARAVRRAAVLLRADAVRGEPVQAGDRARSRSTARARTRCSRTIRSSRSTRRCSTRATSASRSRSRSRSRRSSPAASARAGSPTCAARRSSRGASSPSASCSARGGATRCSGGAATGVGTRSRTRRSCRGSPRPRSSIRVMVQERRGMLRVWNLSLVIATFCLTILGTFLTRSGVINSVHAFSQSSIGPWLLTFLGICAFGGVGLIAWRGDKLRVAGPHRLAAVARSRVPAEQPAVRRRSRSSCSPARCSRCSSRRCRTSRSRSGEPYFERLGVPIGHRAAVPHGGRPGAAVARRERRAAARTGCSIPAWAGAITLVVALVAGRARHRQRAARSRSARSRSTSIGRSVVVGRARAPARDSHEALPIATVRTVRGNPRLYGGLLVHVGVVVIAVALATTGGLHDEDAKCS